MFSFIDLVVVELAGVGDLRLGAGELFLQREEVLVGLEVGIVLDDRHQLAEVGGDLVLGLGLRLHALSASIAPARARRDVLEQLPLVRGVPLDRLDQVGDQVVATTQLHVDAGPPVVDARAVRDEPVVEHDGAQEHEGDDRG